MPPRTENPASMIGRLSRTFSLVLALALLSGCAARELQDNLAGATAQRLVTYAIEDLVSQIPEADFAPYRGQAMRLDSHFIAEDKLRNYADQRLARELLQRFDIRIVDPLDPEARFSLSVFYTALGTDQGLLGFYLPLGAVPGMDDNTRINLISLEQFHGVAEMFYFIDGEDMTRQGPRLLGRTRTDALGLPIITIPISSLD